MSVFIRLNQGGSVNYQDSVANPGDLPTEGNTAGDIRGVISNQQIYMWDGASWVNVSSGGGGTPGGSSGQVQFNNGGSFAGAPELTWDNTGKVLGLNGLAISALSSSVSLVDNQSSPVTAFSYAAASYEFTIIEFSLTRAGSKAVGILFICNDASTASLTKQGTDLTDLGVKFSVSVSAGNVNIQYTTTSTGQNAFLKYAIRQWI